MQGIPGRSGKAFDALDDNAIALDEADELGTAMCGGVEGDDVDIEAQLDADLGVDIGGARQSGASGVRVPIDLGLPDVCDVPLVSRADLFTLSGQEPVLPGF